MAFDNFNAGKAKLRMITGHRYKTEDLNIFTKLFLKNLQNHLKEIH